MQRAANLAARRRWEEAARLWDEIIARGHDLPDDLSTTRHIRALRGAKRLDDASAAAERALARFAESRRVLVECAETAQSRKDWCRAAELWGAAARHREKRLVASQIASRVAAELGCGNGAAAIEIANEALARTPDDPVLAMASGTAELARRVAEGAEPDHRPYLGAGTRSAAGRSLTIPDICETFWEIEARHHLLDWQINGVAVWPLMRMSTYYETTRATGLFDAPHPAQGENYDALGPSDRAQIEGMWDRLSGSTNDPRKASANPERSLLETLARRLSRGGNHAILMATRRVDGSEPYSDAVRREAGSRALLLDRPHAGSSVDAVNLDALGWLFQQRFGGNRDRLLVAEDHGICQRIRADLARSLGIDSGDLAGRCAQRVGRFVAIRKGARRFFDLHRIGTLFLTNAYGASNQAFVAGARDTGARVVELQHGFISRFHLGYSWPGRPDVPNTPDQLWCFGAYWPETTPLAAGVKTRVIGAPYVRELAQKTSGRRLPNRVVFTSQGVIGEKLLGLALETARRRPDLEVIFRLHPNEALRDYETRLATIAPLPDNFSVSHRTPNIFALLAETWVQVGAFSTTLFEGMALGTRTVVVDLPGSEYMIPAINRGDAILARGIGELPDAIDRAPLARDPTHYYADPPPRLIPRFLWRIRP